MCTDIKRRVHDVPIYVQKQYTIIQSKLSDIYIRGPSKVSMFCALFCQLNKFQFNFSFPLFFFFLIKNRLFCKSFTGSCGVCKSVPTWYILNITSISISDIFYKFSVATRCKRIALQNTLFVKIGFVCVQGNKRGKLFVFFSLYYICYFFFSILVLHLNEHSEMRKIQ